MVVGAPAEKPAELAVCLGDRMLVDAGDAAPHRPIGIEFPVLVAVGAKPRAAVVVAFAGEAHGDAIAGERPEFLDQTIVVLARPRALEERFYRLLSVDELGSVPPLAVGRIGERYLGRIAAVPSVLGEPDLSVAVCSVNGGNGGRDMKRLPSGFR